MRCDSCGRFCNRLFDVPCNPGYLGIDREVCARCAAGLGLDCGDTLAAAQPVDVAVHNSGVTRTRLTLTPDEVRVKFPGSTDNSDYWRKEAMQYRDQAMKAALSLWHHLGVTSTLRGRMAVTDGGGLAVTLVNTNGRKRGRYYIDANLTVTGH